jgi:hypothetical protein
VKRSPLSWLGLLVWLTACGSGDISYQQTPPPGKSSKSNPALGDLQAAARAAGLSTPPFYVQHVHQTLQGQPIAPQHAQEIASRFRSTAACQEQLRSLAIGSQAETSGGDDATFVDKVYRALFYRDGGDEGRSYWVGRLQAGMTRSHLIASFIDSPEGVSTCELIVDAQKDAAFFVDRKKTLQRACYCINCTVDEAKQAATAGCRYLRWAVYPWAENSIDELRGTSAPDDQQLFFTHVAEIAAAAPQLVVEFGIPENVAPINAGNKMVLATWLRTEVNQTVEQHFGVASLLSSSTPFAREAITRGNHFPRLDTQLGWAWHYAMAVQAIRAGARAISMPQMNLRMDTLAADNLITLIDAIQNYAMRTTGSRVIIGSESIQGFDPSAQLDKHIHFIKHVLDTDVAQKDGHRYYARDGQGQQVSCMGAEQLAAVEGTVSFANYGSFYKKGLLCALDSNRHYNTHAFIHPHVSDNPHGIETIFWELDGCHACFFTDSYKATITADGNGGYNHPSGISNYLAPDSEYVVWAKAAGNNDTTICYGNVRNGLTTTMQFLTQPASVRRALITYLAMLTRDESRDGSRNVVFPRPVKIDQNHYWQVVESKSTEQKTELRQCPDDRGQDLPTMHQNGPFYWAQRCGDTAAISNTLTDAFFAATTPTPTPTPNCTAGQLKSCSVPHGRGERTCLADGSAYGSCRVVSCHAGYWLQNAACEDLQKVQVQAAFELVLERPESGAGLTFYQQQLESGQKTTMRLLADLAFSSEFQTLHAGRNNEQFVDRLYQRFLQRAADSAGRQFWMTELSSGRQSRAEVARAFIEGPEFSKVASHAVYFAR